LSPHCRKTNQYQIQEKCTEFLQIDNFRPKLQIKVANKGQSGRSANKLVYSQKIFLQLLPIPAYDKYQPHRVTRKRADRSGSVLVTPLEVLPPNGIKKTHAHAGWDHE